ncbi:spindle assembly checkpoint kinase-like [Acipenser oxyrinchus oxyrinchus]|uniref:Spindle assembly checkpoint kinase-like n=1 Tax=Acipenser oxyrinchus oxyrinchus TaxID=40147 RepID=A0AAD8CS05_ACIOX|nr:spindle assembly checkpoint kinase-like [Acipenser oxyrinchus oxyrinchus]
MATYSRRTIGQGCYGKVYKTQYKGEVTAMKKIPESKIKQKNIDREIQIYQKLNHPNIVKMLFDPWKEDGNWHFPLEFIDGEDLEKVLFKQRESKIMLSRSAKVTIINGMCQGLSFLHEKNIVHQDLKPDNIMIEYVTFRPVLVDFGVAKITSSTGFSTATNIGNEAYAAPEVFQGSDRNKSTDIWAMGKIITELLLGSIVETEKCGCRYVEKILKGMPYAKSVSQMVYTDPCQRVEMRQILGDIEMAGEAFKREGYIDDALISNTMFQGRTTEVTKKLHDLVEKRSVYEIPDVGGAMLPFHQASSDRAYFRGMSLGRDPLMGVMDSFRRDMTLVNFPQTEVIKHETQKLVHYTARGTSDNMSAVIREGHIEKVQGRVMDCKYSERTFNPQP